MLEYLKNDKVAALSLHALSENYLFVNQRLHYLMQEFADNIYRANIAEMDFSNE
jgi:hypothetical protein